MEQFEVWHPVFDEPGYMVSTLGSVMSLNYMRTGKERVLKQATGNHGYKVVNIKGRTYTVHSLVAKAFIENAEGLPQVNHKDSNKTNNAASNLEWCSNQYNSIHALLAGARRVKLRHKDISDIRSEYMSVHGHYSNADNLANKYGVTKKTIQDIVSRKDAYKYNPV